MEVQEELVGILLADGEPAVVIMEQDDQENHMLHPALGTEE